MDPPINEDVVFMWFDYGLFFLMLALSILIGLYFGCCGKQNNADEYLLGSKSMSILPIATSLVASYVSGIMLLAVPADVYRYGATYYILGLGYIPTYFITSYVFLPVFFKLQVFSTYEYLSLRFNRKIRLLASFLYTLNTLLYLPVVVYIPALALAQATQISIHIITPVVCFVCIFYTTIGGLKAVVWTDTLQFFVMIGSMIAVLIVGMKSVGGFGNVWSKALQGGRLDFDFDFDPTKRDTAVTVFIGGLFILISNFTSQSCIQKYLALPTIGASKKSIALVCFGLFFIISYIILTGLMMYTRYFDCEPFTAGKIKARDQILPYYILDVARNVPGLAGLFLSGIFSAGLSTLSAQLNSLSGTIYEDFLSLRMPEDISQKKVSNILKMLVVIIGVISTALVFVIEKMGSIFPVQTSLNGITIGPLLGLFTLGMLFPSANEKGALYGGLGGMILMSIIIGGGQITQINGLWSYPGKSVSVEGCTNTSLPINATLTNLEQSMDADNVNPIFKISFYYYCCLGTIFTILLGLIVSFFTNDVNFNVDKDLISPVSHWMMKNQKKPEVVYSNIEGALELNSSTMKS